MAYGTTPEEGRHRHHVARLEPLGPDAEAGDDGRAQRGRASTCSTSRWPRVPVTRFLVRRPGVRRAASRSASSRATRSRCVIRFFDTARRSTSPRTRSARSSGCSAGRTSAGCSRPRSATSGSRPGRSSTTPLRWSDRRHRGDPRGRLQGRRRLRLRLDVLRHAQRARQARCRRARREPLRLDRRRASSSTAPSTPSDVAALVQASGAHLGAVIDPDGEHLTLIDDEGHVLTDTEALLALLSWCRAPPRRPVALPVTVTQPRRCDRGRGRRARPTHEAVDPRADGRRHRAGRRLRRQHRRRLHPPRLPARLRCRRHAGEGARAARPHADPSLRGRRPPAPAAPRPRDGGDALGAEGHGHAHARRAEQGPRASSWSTA